MHAEKSGVGSQYPAPFAQDARRRPENRMSPDRPKPRGWQHYHRTRRHRPSRFKLPSDDHAAVATSLERRPRPSAREPSRAGEIAEWDRKERSEPAGMCHITMESRPLLRHRRLFWALIVLIVDARRDGQSRGSMWHTRSGGLTTA